MNDGIAALERAVASFVTGFNESNIGDRTRDHVRALLKDQFANQIGASQLPWSKKVREFRNPRPGRSTIVAESIGTANAVDAAYLNATYGHGFEYDDFAGNAHPGCCVIPAAVAIGEELDASLGQVVIAMLAGYETYVRIGYPASPALLNAGWQPHSVLANFGAAAVAAKMYNFDAERTSNTLGIALSHAGGPTEYASTGGSIKRVHAGMSVRNGIESAHLARVGVTGPRRYLTGDRGLYRMFVNKTIGDDAIALFHSDAAMQIHDMKFKPYCCCAATHAYIEAMAQIRSRVVDVVSVDANIQTMADSIVGNRNVHLYDPGNIEELQYSLVVQMALSALDRGNGYKTHRAYLEGNLPLTPRSDVIQFASKIKVHIDTALDARYPRNFVADVVVHYRNGPSDHIFLDRITGSPSKPFTKEEFQSKLDELTESVIGPRQAKQLFDHIDRLDFSTPIRKLTSLLVPE